MKFQYRNLWRHAKLQERFLHRFVTSKYEHKSLLRFFSNASYGTDYATRKIPISAYLREHVREKSRAFSRLDAKLQLSAGNSLLDLIFVAYFLETIESSEFSFYYRDTGRSKEFLYSMSRYTTSW